jgi:tetratricopeptide (TPR) repeat protein
LQAKPCTARVYFNRGVAKNKHSLADDALLDYTKAIECDPNYSKAYNNRGLNYLRKGRLAEAITDFTKAIELTLKDPLPFFNRAFAYFEEMVLDKALADCAVALSLDEKFADAYGLRGLILLKVGRDAEAQSDFAACAKLSKRCAADLEPRIRQVLQQRRTSRF